MIFTMFGNEVEILSLVDVHRQEVRCLIKYGDGSSRKRNLLVSELKADDGLVEIQGAIQKLTGGRA